MVFLNKKILKFFVFGFFISIFLGIFIIKKSESFVMQNSYDNVKFASQFTNTGDQMFNIGLSQLINGSGEKTIAKKLTKEVNEIWSDAKTVRLKVRQGDTLSTVLQRAGIGYSEIREVSKSLKDIFDITTLKPFTKEQEGDVFSITLVEIPEASRVDKSVIATLKQMEIIRSPVEKVVSKKTDFGFASFVDKVAPAIKLVNKGGVIKEGQSFIYSANKLDTPYDVIAKFYDVLSFDVDFERDIHPGDSFEVMYEEKYAPNGDFLEVGDILYAELVSKGKKIALYRYKRPDGRTAYYDENGKGASKTLKKTPLNGARITSKYGIRKDPVLGYTKKHKGVDFAAPTGTPIPAAGDGIVEKRGWNNGGYGNMVKIRHNGTYSTLYAHMSQFKKGVVVGTRVKQGDIIGYVGSTGWSTGPHLHYEIIKNGVAVNPGTIKLPSTDNLSGEVLQAFLVEKSNIQNVYASLKTKSNSGICVNNNSDDNLGCVISSIKDSSNKKLAVSSEKQNINMYELNGQGGGL